MIQNAKDNFDNAINPSDPDEDEFLAIAHDIHEQTALNLTGHMLDVLVAKGYRGVTMGECLGDDVANWYRDETGGIPTSALPSATVSVSPTSASTGPTATPTDISSDGHW